MAVDHGTDQYWRVLTRHAGSQKALARALGVALNTLRGWQSGKANPSRMARDKVTAYAQTVALDRMQAELSQDDLIARLSSESLRSWLERIREKPLQTLRSPRMLWTLDDLMEAFHAANPHELFTRRQFMAHLKALKIPRFDDKPIELGKRSKRHVLWIIQGPLIRLRALTRYEARELYWAERED